jgi:hypothetical protein
MEPSSSREGAKLKMDVGKPEMGSWRTAVVCASDSVEWECRRREMALSDVVGGGSLRGPRESKVVATQARRAMMLSQRVKLSLREPHARHQLPGLMVSEQMKWPLIARGRPALALP